MEETTDQTAHHQVSEGVGFPKVRCNCSMLGIKCPLGIDAVGISLGCLGWVRCAALVGMVSKGWIDQ